MRVRVLKVQPAAAQGWDGAHCFPLGEERHLVVLSTPPPAEGPASMGAVYAEALARGLTDVTVVVLPPEHTLTVLDVDDPTDEVWHEDGRPDRAELERELVELRTEVARLEAAAR